MSKSAQRAATSWHRRRCRASRGSQLTHPEARGRLRERRGSRGRQADGTASRPSHGRFTQGARDTSGGATRWRKRHSRAAAVAIDRPTQRTSARLVMRQLAPVTGASNSDRSAAAPWCRGAVVRSVGGPCSAGGGEGSRLSHSAPHWRTAQDFAATCAPPDLPTLRAPFVTINELIQKSTVDN